MAQPQLPGGPQGLNQWLAGVARELTPIHVELAPLRERETLKMVRSILALPAPGFAQWLYDETRGQPFFYLMETLKDLQLGRAYTLGGQTEKALAVDAERERLG